MTIASASRSSTTPTKVTTSWSVATGPVALIWTRSRRGGRRALLGTTEPIVDLYLDVDPERDHVRGPADALVTLVEYGDFECPYCGQAEVVVRELLSSFGADLSGVSGTPTFFVNGRRHYGAYDIETLSRAVRAAGARAVLASS